MEKRKKQILISHEVPRCLLNDSIGFCDYQYALPHLLESDEEYRNHFLKCKEQGIEIYLDNSLHELGTSVSDELLIKWINILEPTTFFVPDVWEDASGSMVNAKRWANIKVPDKTTKTAIVQAKNMTEIVACVQTYKDLGYKKIAFSYGNSFYNELNPHPNKDLSKALGRIKVIGYLYKRNLLTKYDRVHLLGTSYPGEFAWYNEIECIESIDTSSPIMATLDREGYNAYGLYKKPKSNLNNSFDIDIRNIPLNLLSRNVRMFRIMNGLNMEIFEK